MMETDSIKAPKRTPEDAVKASGPTQGEHMASCKLDAKPKKVKVGMPAITTASEQNYEDVLFHLKALKLKAKASKEEVAREEAKVAVEAKENAKKIFMQDLTTPIRQPRFANIYRDTLEQPELNKHLYSVVKEPNK